MKLRRLLTGVALTPLCALALAAPACNWLRREPGPQAGAGSPPAGSPPAGTPSPAPTQRQRLDDPAQLQTKNFEPRYKVSPVAAPTLRRPPLVVAREALPRGAAGALPTFDGEPFQLNLPPGGETFAEGQAGELVARVLRAIGWQRAPEELRQAGRVTAPGAKAEPFDAALGREQEAEERRLAGRTGGVAEGARGHLRERREQSKAAAARTQTVIAYEQRVDGLRVENSGLNIVSAAGGGLRVVKGRVFNQVNVTNRRALSAEDAQRAAAGHVARTTRLSERALPPNMSATPELVILPYGDAMRYAWRVDLMAEEGPYRLWIDAGGGEVLQLMPMFWFDSGRALVFEPDPGVGTKEMSFAIDAPSNNVYTLTVTNTTGVQGVSVVNSGADGTNVSVTVNAGGGEANFNVAPFNDTTVKVKTDAGYNGGFQVLNAFGWVYRSIQHNNNFGGLPLPAFTVTVNDACGGSPNNAWGSLGSVTFCIGSGTLSNSTGTGDLFNTALDATMVGHEFGHSITPNQMGTTNVNGLHGAVNEGLSDYWAAVITGNPKFCGWSAQNQDAATGPVQTGWLPRLPESQDVFPEHRALGNTDIHADGQIINWALWGAAQGHGIGTTRMDDSLMKALTTHGLGLSTSSSDKDVHDAFADLLGQLALQYGDSNLSNGLFAGFADAGIHLSERDAVIDVGDYYLDRKATSGPTFTVWTGRDYQFDAAGAATAASVFNTTYEVDAANDAAFTQNLSTSPAQTNVAVNADGVPKAQWTMPQDVWNTLKAGERIYYRVRTSDGTSGNKRDSLQPGNNFLGAAVPAPYAVVNDSGGAECSCAATVAPTAPGYAPLVLLLGPLAALLWMMSLRRGGAAR